jgi:hypothetical protein
MARLKHVDRLSRCPFRGKTGSDRRTVKTTRMTHPDLAVPSASDTAHLVKYASLVTRSPEAGLRFIKLCETMAADLLRPWFFVLMALATVLRIKRTLTGAEIDALIANTCAGFELASERHRRTDWRRRELSADRFRAEYHHAHDSPLPHRVHDQMEKFREV